MYSLSKIERFNRNVLSKFHVYNGVFLTLPFDQVYNTGALLPLFSDMCEKGFIEEKSPEQIVDDFILKYGDVTSESKRIDLFFRLIQYIERQVVLFDAIEDAAFPIVNNIEGKGSLRAVKERIDNSDLKLRVADFLKSFQVRTVLTAHPTQFYPGSVLGIITDLTHAVKNDDLFEIKNLLSQLGKTPFIKIEKPSPLDEATSLLWYLENVFYETAGEMSDYIRNTLLNGLENDNTILNLGFWPGGDRDGNPFVTTEITIEVACRLRYSILKCYYLNIRQLKRKLTFSGVDILVAEIENKIYRTVFYSKGEMYITLDELKSKMLQIRSLIVDNHQSLYLNEVDSFLAKLNLFGFYFASLDIRENSKIHDRVLHNVTSQLISEQNESFPSNYQSLSADDKLRIASQARGTIDSTQFNDPQTRLVLESIQAIKQIQAQNGEQGCHRYIISNTESAQHVIDIFALFRLSGWENPTVDIVPLFEIIEDLKIAGDIMTKLYSNEAYAKHLCNRGMKQTVMLGFSDGTKDGGYLMANWSIFKAKETITSVSRQFGIEVLFFDGRGGPPARGGGKTHKFYASLGSNIENRQIQLTIQGQTISSNFGTIESARYNLENLLTAGIENVVLDSGRNDLNSTDKEILDELATIGFDKYISLKNHAMFVPYLEQMSTLNFYQKTNIGSRPAKRSQSTQLDLADLRAIPFVGSWSQLKQNVPGFFGVGTALKHFEDAGKWDDVCELYNRSLFFRTLLENSMMSVAKSFLPLTAYIKDDPDFGAFWHLLNDEYTQTKRLLLKLAGHTELMENYPDGKASIAVREKIVMPLLVIQQYALLKIRKLRASGSTDEQLIATYEKLVTRSMFGNTNASRNSA